MGIINTGTEMKIAVSITDLGEQLTMDDLDFTCKFYTSTSKVVTLTKADMIREDATSYLAPVDTAGMASGEIMLTVEATVFDADFADGKRTEITTMPTGITIKRVTV